MKKNSVIFFMIFFIGIHINAISSPIKLSYEQCFDLFNDQPFKAKNFIDKDKWRDRFLFQSKPSFSPGLIFEIYYNDYSYLDKNEQSLFHFLDLNGILIISTTIDKSSWESFYRYNADDIPIYVYKNGKITQKAKKPIKKPKEILVNRDSVYICDQVLRDELLKIVKDVISYPKNYYNRWGLDGTGYSFEVYKFRDYQIQFNLWSPDSTSKEIDLISRIEIFKAKVSNYKK